MSEQSEQDDREALVKAALKVLHPNATRNMPMALDYAHKIADAIIAAGFRRSPAPQQVSTVEELDALPVGSVVHSRLVGGLSIVATRGQQAYGLEDFPWTIDGHKGNYSHVGVEEFMGFPLTVLYRPEGRESA